MTRKRPARLNASLITLHGDQSPLLGPQAGRDTDTPDLGYHYPPLDYLFGGVTNNANLTFSAGTAVGWFRTTQGWQHAGHGIHIADRKTVTFDGHEDAPNYFHWHPIASTKPV